MKKLIAIMVAGAAIAGGCNGDEEPETVTVIERTVTETTPAPAEPGRATPPTAPEPAPEPELEGYTSCADVTFTENSGDGAFDVKVRGIGCPDAENLLRSQSGLTSWNCRSKRQGAGGSERYVCKNGSQEIIFSTGI